MLSKDTIRQRRRMPARTACAGAAAAVAALVTATLAGSSSAEVRLVPERHPQTSWVACNRNARTGKPSTFHPLSDAQAARLVTREPEVRPDNDRPYTLAGRRYPGTNEYVPTKAQIAAFRRAKVSNGQTNTQFNPYYRYVDGLDGMKDPSTDDLIQWAAHKWGIPENWLKAEFVLESYWNAFQLGDATSVPASSYDRYPPQSRIPGSTQVYQSLGITQVRWVPGGSLHPGTEPLRWESTAFNLDYQAATIRFYYDNPQGTRSSWGDTSYKPCEKWNSIGAWYDPYPWSNSGQAQYAHTVQKNLADQAWRSSAFLSWTLSSAPPGIKFR